MCTKTLATLISLSISISIIQSCDYFLCQTDFALGTYRIQQSGTYCITEDIEFNPRPGSNSSPNAPGAWDPVDNDAFPGSEDQITGAYVLGFFAVIAIETSDVVIDLQGHEIKWSFEFYIQQRYGAIIEIANAPFLPSTGPAQFEGDGFINVDNIEIKNGILGLSSHHGIHSNGASNVVIRNLIIEDFEVGGIQLNGFNGATLENLKIGPSFDQVPLTG